MPAVPPFLAPGAPPFPPVPRSLPVMGHACCRETAIRFLLARFSRPIHHLFPVPPAPRDRLDDNDHGDHDDLADERGHSAEEHHDGDERAPPSSRDIPAPPSSGNALATVSNIPPRESKDRITVALHRFLASKHENEGQAFVRGCIIFKLYGHKPKTIEPEIVDEVAQTAQREALELRWPPWTIGGIPGWVKRLAERNVAAYFDKQKKDRKYLQPGGDIEESAWDRNAPETDYGAREHLIVKYMKPLVGDDPYDKETYRLMWEKEIVGHSLGELAAEKGTTAKALSDRLYKLRKRLAPKVSIMDREKPRRAILIFLIVGAAASVLLTLWYLFHPTASPPEEKPQPAPSATAGPAPVPTFNQALPKPPVPAPPETAAPPTPAAPPVPQPAPPRPAPAPRPGNAPPGEKGP